MQNNFAHPFLSIFKSSRLRDVDGMKLWDDTRIVSSLGTF